MVENNKKQSTNLREKVIKKILSSDALVIAIIPIIAYIFVYVLYLGYFFTFHIPTNFISFDIYKIFVAIIGVITIITFFVVYGYPFFQTLKTIPLLLRNKLGPLFIALIFYLFFVFTFGVDSDYTKYLPIVLIVYFLPSFFWPCIRFRKIKGYMNKLQKEEELKINSKKADEKSDSKPLYKAFFEFIGPEIIIFTFFLFFLFNFGRASALRQEEFPIINTDPEKVVLYMSSDFMICSNFDRSNKTVDQSFVIIKFGEDPNLELTSEKVGPLKSIPINSGHKESLINEIITPTILQSPTKIITPTLPFTPKPLPSQTQQLSTKQP